MSHRWLILLCVFFASQAAMAANQQCSIAIKDLNEQATRIVKHFASQKQDVPDSLVLMSDLELNKSESAVDSTAEAVFEGFFRPAEDDNYALTPLPFLTVPLDRDRHMIYVCAHYSPDPSKTHVTIYLMRGFNLEKSKIGSFIGNTFRSPQLEIKPLSIVLLDVQQVRRVLSPVFRWIPVVDWSLALTDTFQRALISTVTDFARLGVERITVTPEGIELATGVNQKSPDKALFKRLIKFEKAP